MIEIGKPNNAFALESGVSIDQLGTELENPLLKLKTLAEKYGCRFFAMLHSPQANQSLKDVLIFSNWPASALEGSEGFFPALSTDLSKRISETIVPFQWSLDIVDSASMEDVSKHVVDLFQDFELLNGLIIPVHGPDKNVGFVAFGGMERILEQDDIAVLQFASIELFDLHFKARQSTRELQGRLTPREVKILQLMVDGHSMEDIAEIMELSPMTIGIYAGSAKSKLNSSTKVQAIAQAIRNRIIG